MTQNSLTERLVPLDRYQAERETIFPSMASLRWFVHCNRDELVSAGALVKPAARSMAVVERFDEAVQKIGADRARLVRR